MSTTYLEAERAVLGALILVPDRLGEALELVLGEDFSDSRHVLIFDAITKLSARGIPVDFISLELSLTESGYLGAIGGTQYLVELAESIASAARLPHHARVVALAARVRRNKAALLEAARECDDVSLADVNDGAQHLDAIEHTAFSKLAQRREVARATRIDALRDQRRERLSKLKSGELDGLSTGIADVDALMLGMRPGWFILAGGRTSIGKSAFGLQIARNVAAQGHNTLFVSYEMSDDQIAERVMLHEPDALTGIPLDVVRPTDKSVMALRGMVRRQKQLGLEFLVLDYIQNMRERGSESRLEELTAISSGVQLLSYEYQIPVLAMAQLSRKADDADALRLSHLRECGALEQDADVVILLGKGRQENELTCEFAKHRHGPTGVKVLGFFRDRQRIVDLSGGAAA